MMKWRAYGRNAILVAATHWGAHGVWPDVHGTGAFLRRLRPAVPRDHTIPHGAGELASAFALNQIRSDREPADAQCAAGFINVSGCSCTRGRAAGRARPAAGVGPTSTCPGTTTLRVAGRLSPIRGAGDGNRNTRCGHQREREGAGKNSYFHGYLQGRSPGLSEGAGAPRSAPILHY